MVCYVDIVWCVMWVLHVVTLVIYGVLCGCCVVYVGVLHEFF